MIQVWLAQYNFLFQLGTSRLFLERIEMSHNNSCNLALVWTAVDKLLRT